MREGYQRTVTLLLVALLLLPFASCSPLTVSLSKGTYRPGETVTLTIQGKASKNYGIQVVDPVGALVAVKQITTDSGGKASFSFTLPSDARLGTYTIYVAGGGESATVTFTVEAAPPPPAPPPPAPATVAAAAISSARSRFQLLLRVFFILNQSLGPLGLEGVLADISNSIAEVNSTLRDAEAKYSAGDYSSASNLASSASARAGQLISLAFELSVNALRGFAGSLRNSTSDWLVLALLNLTDSVLGKVSPTYVDASLESIDLASKILLAAKRIADGAQLEEKVEELNRKLADAEKTLDAMRRRVGELEGKVGQLEGEKAQLSASLNRAEAELSSARNELEQLRAENQQLRTQNAELEQQLASATSQANTARIIAVALLAIGLAAGFAVGYILRARKRA
ncbi:MAG: MG2 domain-containing protein [Thermofilaceae archaeon]